MYNTSQITRFAACILTTTSLIACDSATINEDRNVGLLDDIDTTFLGDATGNNASFENCAPVEIDLSGTRLLGHASASETTASVDLSLIHI